MRRLLAVGGSVAIVLAAAACGGTKTIVKTVQVQPKPSATGDLRYYGHIKTLTRSGTGYVLRFDPVWFLSGVTANVAQAEDAGTKCAPKACEPVPNDNYRVDEGHRVRSNTCRNVGRSAGRGGGARALVPIPGCLQPSE
jgi:hypothetical protein